VNLEEILRKHVGRRPGDPPLKTVDPLPAGRSPVVINGMVELLRHLHELSRRLDAVEKRLAELEKR
jgi:hypothetical protein